MADLKISQLTGVTTPLAGTEVLPIVQSSATKKVTAQELTGSSVAAYGIVGFGAVPAPWGTLAKAVDVGSGGASLSYNFSETNLGTNMYRTNTGGSFYKTAGIANMYSQSSSGHAWLSAVSGIADAAISFTPVLSSDATTSNITVNTGNLIIGTSGKGITGSSSFSVTLANGAVGTLVDLATALPAGASGLVIVNGASAGKTTILAQRDSGGYYSVTELGTQPRGTYITSIGLSGTNLQITNSTGGSETFSGKVTVFTA